MESLGRTIKKLSEEQYKELLAAVAGRKNNKPYLVLEAARNFNYDENGMMNMLGVNPSAYYTLKSRLNEKIAAYLSKNMDNPINALKEKVAMVPAMLFGKSREVSIRSLKNLEKELIEYDLSNELITIYKSLARLSMYNGDYDYYEREYNRHVAYSLAVVKAEDLFFEFTKRAGQYILTREQNDLDALQTVLRELTNISELYHGHRLFVLHNIVRLYYLCITLSKEKLQTLELEVDQILQQINKHFETYQLDTFYQSIRYMVDLLYMEYYTRTGNEVRADHHYEKIKPSIPGLAYKPVFSFHIIQFLNSKADRAITNNNMTLLNDLNDQLHNSLDTEVTDVYSYIYFKRYLAICNFYNQDYQAAAKIINGLRNDISLKRYMFTDIESKLFQALNYCMLGEDSLADQIFQSLKRQLADQDENDPTIVSASAFLKFLRAAVKPEEFRKKVQKLNELYKKFIEVNIGQYKMLSFINLDDATIRRLANPLKEN